VTILKLWGIKGDYLKRFQKGFCKFSKSPGHES
jgi:hypothetical protein